MYYVGYGVLVPIGFPTIWRRYQKIIKKIRKIEDKFWDDDEKLEVGSV